MTVVSVGDLNTPTARRRRAEWMLRFDVGQPPAPIGRPMVTATQVTPGTDLTDFLPPPAVDLLGPAVALGWFVQLFYSKGPRLGANGKALGIGECVSVRAYRFPAEWCVITYERAASQIDWSAGNGWLWDGDCRPRKVGVAIAKSALTGKAVEPDDLTAVELRVEKGACVACGKLTSLNKDGTVRVHGPKDDRCHGSRRVPVGVTTVPA